MSAILFLTGAIAVITVRACVIKERRKRRKIRSLECDWPIAVIGLIFIVLACLGFGVMIRDCGIWFSNCDVLFLDRERILVIGGLSGIWLPGVLLLVVYFSVGGSFDEDGISFFTPWTGRKEERWVDLTLAKYNNYMRCYVLKFKSGSVIRLSSEVMGNYSVLSKFESVLHGVR